MVGSVMNLGTWPTGADTAQIQRVADQLYSAGLLGKPLNVRPLMFSPATSG